MNNVIISTRRHTGGSAIQGCLVILVICIVCIGLIGLIIGGAYGSLNTADQEAQAAWGDVESAYQRRSDLIPQLVSTVKASGKFEQDTLTKTTEARASIGRVTVDASKLGDQAQQLEAFQKAQGQISSALSEGFSGIC